MASKETMNAWQKARDRAYLSGVTIRIEMNVPPLSDEQEEAMVTLLAVNQMIRKEIGRGE